MPGALGVDEATAARPNDDEEAPGGRGGAVDGSGLSAAASPSSPSPPTSPGGSRGRTALNVALLGFGWALAASGLFVQVSTTSLAVNALRPGTPLATVPVALFFLAAASCLIPLSLLARRTGRAPVFLAATALAAAGAALQLGAAYVAAAAAAAAGNNEPAPATAATTTTTTAAAPLAMLSVGALLQGPSFATANNYRFAAAEFVDAPALRPRAISLVVACAVIAAALGPEVSRLAVGAVAGKPYAGAYAYLIAIYGAQIVVLALVDWRLLRDRQKAHAELAARLAGRQQQEQAAAASEEAPLAQARPPPPPIIGSGSSDGGRGGGGGGSSSKAAPAALVPTPPPPPPPKEAAAAAAAPPTPYRALLLTRDFLVAALCCAGAFAGMAALMALTPLRVVGRGLGPDLASHTVVAHILAMYLPAAVMGDAVRVFGVAPVAVGGFLTLLAGTLAFLADGGGSSSPSSPSIAAAAFYSGMVLIGAGWSGAYVASSSLAASCYASEPAERRFPIQAATDSCVLLLSGFAMGSATPLLRAEGFGWSGVVALYAAADAALALVSAWWGVDARRRRRRRRPGGG